VSFLLYLNSNKAWPSNQHTTRAKSLSRRLSSTRRTLVQMHESLWTREGSRLGSWVTDIFPIRRTKGHTYGTGASGAQTDRRGTMLYDIGNSERTGQDLRYEWLLSTSKGSNGLRGDSGSGFRSFSFFLWVA
jgi:hypothetical protein